MTGSRLCFVIAPIGDESTEIRRRSDTLFRYIIAPVVIASGYEPVRADQIDEPGAITTQVIQRVVNAPLVIADLTGHNPNVFYEIAIRHAFGKPVIQLILQGERIPFDVAPERTIFYDTHDLASAEKAKQDLAAQIEIINQGDIDIRTPVSVAVEISSLRDSGDPTRMHLAELSESMAELRSAMFALERRMSDPESLVPRRYLRSLFADAYQGRMRTAILADLSHLGVLLKDAEAKLEQFMEKTARPEAYDIEVYDVLQLIKRARSMERGMYDRLERD